MNNETNEEIMIMLSILGFVGVVLSENTHTQIIAATFSILQLILAQNIRNEGSE